MKKKPPLRPTYANAAERVKFLFLKGAEILISLNLMERTKLQSLKKCNLVELPKFPELLRMLSLNVLRAELKKKTSPSSKKASFENSNLVLVSDPNSFLKPALWDAHTGSADSQTDPEAFFTKPSNELDPNRVRGWSVKEYLLAARQLKELRKQQNDSHASKKYEITVLQEEDSGKEEDKQQFDQWEEFIKAKQERHFQLTRVIKYFTDL
jgi:hypothetical protein